MTKSATPREDEREPIVDRENGGAALLDGAHLAVAVVTVGLVALWFKLDVNRVFDVPKAFALKVGGCGVLLSWLLYGLFGRGHPVKSLRVFGGPVLALALAVAMSTILSIDVPMSLFGVYERQFGLQGFLGCIGLFVATATALRSQRGAIAGLAILMMIGGVVGTYSLLQATGHDPFGFFKEPHNKVYSTLGNATFAGNALALIFPMSLILAIVAFAKTTLDPQHRAPAKLTATPLFVAFGAGAAAILVLQLLPGYNAAANAGSGAATKEATFKATVGLSLLVFAAAGLAGTWGPAWSRLQSVAAQRYCDAFAAGSLLASSAGIAIGLLCTRTRGAWVGTFVAVALGLVLLPFLFRDDRALFKKIASAGWGGAVLLVLGVAGFVIVFPGHLYSHTIKSIPYAFSEEHTVYGKGQGTRRFLWAESPRVLVSHGDTLERKYADLEEAARVVEPKLFEGIDLSVEAPTAADRAFDKSWRQVAVWPFGIGIETYRYAFMSHKSKKLEALDPMTNHDNPHNNYLYTLASFGLVGLAAYLWLLWRLLSVSACRFAGWENRHAPQPESGMESRASRALAFGVLTSFFSYSVYSIAGFDSVACSVFLYFFLGCASALFAPAKDEPRLPLSVHVRRWLAARRGQDPQKVPAEAAMGASLAVAAVLGTLLVHAILSAVTIRNAERAFVGETRRTSWEEKIDGIISAIELNPYESFYKQSLGGTLSDASRRMRSQAYQLEQSGNTADAKRLITEADKLAARAETALYSALDHAWAPENVFISAFQLYYTTNRLDRAEQALERALDHSPHLGAVRANLAVLKLERKAYDEALADCRWVLEVDPNSAIALRTCGRSAYFKGDLAAASDYLGRAAKASPKDSVTKSYLADLERAKVKAATSSATAAGPG